MPVDVQNLINRAAQIRDAFLPEENTAQRVGSLLLDIISLQATPSQPFTHPSNGANVTINDLPGKFMSAISVDEMGHVSAVSARSILEADIPTLSISKIDNLSNTLALKLDKSVFDEILRVVRNADGSVHHVETDFTFVSKGDLQSLQASEIESGSMELLTRWADYSDADKDFVGLSAGLGADLHNRLVALEGGSGFDPSVLNGLATETWVNQQGFLKAADLSSLPTRLSQYNTSSSDFNDGNGFGRIASNSPFKVINSTSNDCMLVTTAYSDNWRGELALDYRTNNVAYRNKNNGTWNDWAMMLTDKNYAATLDNSYVKKSGDTMTGLLSISTNGKYVKFGCQNLAFAHYETDAITGHYFNKALYVAGEIYAGSSYNQKVWHAGNDGSGSGLDADLLDGKDSSAFLPSISIRDYTLGTLIQTDMPFSGVFYMEITGNGYEQGIIDSKYQGYLYEGSVINTYSTHNGILAISGMVVMNLNGYYAFWFPRQGYWHGYRVYVSNVNPEVEQRNRVTTVSNSNKPSNAYELAFDSANRFVNAWIDSTVSAANKLATARNFAVADYDGSHTGEAVSFNGEGDVTMKLPSTIKLTTLNASGAVTCGIFRAGTSNDYGCWYITPATASDNGQLRVGSTSELTNAASLVMSVDKTTRAVNFHKNVMLNSNSLYLNGSKRLWVDSSGVLRFNGTLLVDGDLQSKVAGGVYGEIVKPDIIYGSTYAVPTTASVVILRTTIDGNLTLTLDGSVNDFDVIYLFVKEYSAGMVNLKYGSTAYEVYNGAFALVNIGGSVFFYKLS